MSSVELPSISKTIEYLASESISVLWNRLGYFCMLVEERKSEERKRKERDKNEGKL